MALNLVLGVDAGLNEVKIVGQKGETKFASVIARKAENERTFKGRMSFEETKKESRFELSVDGRDYYLGEHAIFIDKQSGQQNTGGSDGTGSKNNKKAFIRALGGICLYIDHYERFEDQDINVFLTYGTPVNSAQRDEELDEIEDRFKNYGKPFAVTYNGHRLNITVKDIIVLPEGAAAYYAKEDYEEQDVYIIDAGSQTINLTHLEDGTPVPSGSTNLDVGVEYYKATYPSSTAEVLSEDILDKVGELRWPRGSKVYICGGFTNVLLPVFNEEAQGRFEAEVLNPELPIAGTRKVKTIDPIFANATGLFFIATQAFEDYINVAKPKVKG
ncbi:ParM/StbA family protein [Priestia sp. YIM B13551]|uniref:ParM/StbA family protein n=1 Tax=Priestia sp. YIM B13551 TaxID=3366306 RepID=UPI003670CC8D